MTLAVRESGLAVRFIFMDTSSILVAWGHPRLRKSVPRDFEVRCGRMQRATSAAPPQWSIRHKDRHSIVRSDGSITRADL